MRFFVRCRGNLGEFELRDFRLERSGALEGHLAETRGRLGENLSHVSTLVDGMQ